MFKLSIKIKVLLILLLLTSIMIVVMALNMQRGFSKGFFNYRKAIEQQFHDSLLLTLEHYYREVGHWDELYDNKRLWHDLLNRSTVDVEGMPRRLPNDKAHKRDLKRDQKRGLRDRSSPRGEHARKDLAEMRHQQKHQRERMRLLPPVSLFNTDKTIIVGKKHDRHKKINFIAVKNADQTVAYLGAFYGNNQHRRQDKLFIDNIKTMLLQLAIFMGLLAIIVTFPIAKYFTKLIKQLTEATKKIASGDYSTRIQSQRQDELGDLASNFNVLAKTLEHNAAAQKTMMADIAHELRTPIAVLIGEIEAIQDGVHKADDNTLGLLHSQASSLVNLVDDLRELSESDLGSLKYNMQQSDVHDIIDYCYHNYALQFAQKNIEVNISANQDSCEVIGDIQRLKQLFNNLLSNAVHYTDKAGQVNISIDCDEPNLKVTIADSAPGLNDEQILHIFDRWYRADQSRNRKLGGSGLGLAICQKIVEAHNGSITAQKSTLGGLQMTILLPREHIK